MCAHGASASETFDSNTGLFLRTKGSGSRDDCAKASGDKSCGTSKVEEQIVTDINCQLYRDTVPPDKQCSAAVEDMVGGEKEARRERRDAGVSCRGTAYITEAVGFAGTVVARMMEFAISGF